MTFLYQVGRRDAFLKLGMHKEAIAVGRTAPLLRRLGTWMRSKVPTKQGIQEFAIGDPQRFAEELAQGKAFGKGSLVRSGFKAESPIEKATFYAMPALEAGSTIADDRGEKGRRLGETLGGTALGLAAWRPFGMVGSMVADTLGRRIGGAAGQTAEYLGRGGNLPADPTAQSSQGLLPAARATGAASRVMNNQNITKPTF